MSWWHNKIEIALFRCLRASGETCLCSQLLNELQDGWIADNIMRRRGYSFQWNSIFLSSSPWTEVKGRGSSPAAGRQTFLRCQMMTSQWVGSRWISHLASPATHRKMTGIIKSTLTSSADRASASGSLLDPGLVPPRHLYTALEHQKRGNLTVPCCPDVAFVAYGWIKKISAWRLCPFIIIITKYQGCQNSVRCVHVKKRMLHWTTCLKVHVNALYLNGDKNLWR